MIPTLSIPDQATKSSPPESRGPMTPFRARPGRSAIRLRGWLNLARGALWTGFRTALPTRPVRFKLKPRRVRRGAIRALTREIHAERRALAGAQKLAARGMDRGAAQVLTWTAMGRARARPPRVAPRPRAAHRPRGRAATAPGRGSPAPPEDPDSQSGSAEGDAGGGPQPLVPRRAKGKRGRPRARRSFRAWPDLKVWRKRLAQAEAVATLPGAVFAVLLPTEAPDETARRLARVPAQVADRFAAFARRLRREPGAHFAIATATRAEGGAFYPHAHAIVHGVSPERLAVLAARSGLQLAYAEPVQDGRAAARYVLGAHQKRHYDIITGGRGFWARPPEAAEATATSSVSSGNKPVKLVDTPLGPLPVAPGPVDLGPGVRVVDPERFLEANAQAAASPSPRLRDLALEALLAYASAIGVPLALCGPPKPGAATGKGGRR
ncbi:hypothetical protein TthSNM11_19390 [Thermus thermophilus]|nr:hypothetical protein TthSNM11_19390 [Thermus thermophilus]